MTDRKLKRLLDATKLKQDKSRREYEKMYMERHRVYAKGYRRNPCGTSGIPLGVYYIKCEIIQQGFVVTPMLLDLRCDSLGTFREKDVYSGQFDFGRIMGTMSLAHARADMPHPGSKRMPFRWDGLEFLPEHSGWARCTRTNRTGFLEFTDDTFTKFRGKLRNSSFAKYEIEIQGFQIDH
jgi:hypothetical protein